MRFFNILFCLLFIISAGLQYNDPDPYLWMPIYLYGALLTYLAAKNKYYPKAYAAGIIVFGIYAAYLFFDTTGVRAWMTEYHAENIAQSMKATKPWIEETREFFGLMILIVVLAVDWIYFRVRKS
jgi:hypothetical protein